MPTCPAGHASATADFCDVCWQPIEGASLADSAASKPSFRTQMVPPAGADDPPAERCPRCGSPRLAGGRFCEDDGHDFEAEVRATPPARGAWVLDVAPDREYFRLCAPDGVEFPEGTETRSFVLEGVDLVVGRRSESRNVEPESELACGVADPAVSRLHARFVQGDDDSLAVVDQGSTNGTRLNEAEEPIPPGALIPVTEGDRVHIGAWTTITVHRHSWRR
jgi:FHA domain